MKRFKIKYLKSIGKFVLHSRRPKGRKDIGVWRRVWGYEFATESLARQFAAERF